MAGISQLFRDLCDAHMANMSWKVHLGRRRFSKSRFKQKLKRIAYDTLFTNLFQEDAQKTKSRSSRLPVKNKILMLSFDMRIAGRGNEADRLEELVELLETSDRLPFTEVNLVLELLVELAGSGPPQPLQKRDYFLNNKYVGRNVKYQGYDYYDVSVFEDGFMAQITQDEWHFQDAIQRTVQIMDAAPGTGLPAIGLLSQSQLVGDKFEKETRASLFGALVHSRRCDMDIRLDFPPIPDNADISGLVIKVPQTIDQSEDEGFQSASNLTPDSQSEPSMTPDIDVWEAVLTYEPNKRRCWELIGCPPGRKQEPYLTEGGREAFDKFLRFREGELHILNGTLFPLPGLVLLTESDLVKDVLNVLIGVVSTTFSLDQSLQTFTVKPGVYVSGTSSESMNRLLSELAEYGTYYMRLSRFSLQPVLDSSYRKGLVFQVFTSGLRKYLQYYRACVLSSPPTLSLLSISFLFRKLGRQLRYLSELCDIGGGLSGMNQGPSNTFPTGVKLLSYLYKEALNNCSNEHYPVLLSLLRSSCEPYTRFIYEWVFNGVIRDNYQEFMIQVNEDFLNFRDKHYWTHGYILISKEAEDCVPVFLKHIANEIYICGKTVNLLKLCCPRHYICWSDVPAPCISVSFSLEELQEIEKDTAVYVNRMERIARYSSISREEKDLRTEIARQELIIQARETAAKALEAIKGKQLSERKALDAKKHEAFLELKLQFEKDQERRTTAKQQEADDSFSYAREIREREERLKALEEELERRARRELIEHYSKLSEEAARKEQKALWKIQRHRLETARNAFLLNDEKAIQELLQRFPLGEHRKKLDVLPQSEDLQKQLQTYTKEHGSSLQSLSREEQTFVMRKEAILDESLQLIYFDISKEMPKSSEQSNAVAKEFEHNLPTTEQSAVSTLDESLNLLHFEKSPIQRDSESGTESPLIRTVESQQVPSSSSAPPHTAVSLLDLDIADFLPKMPHTETSKSSERTSVVEAALLEIGSDLIESSQTKEKQLPPLGSHDYDFNTVLRPVTRPHVSQGHIQVGENISHVESRRPHWNVHGHPSASSIKVGDYASDVEAFHPVSNIHGHSSDSHIKAGEYVSDVMPSVPRWNVHGHVSSAHIKVGEYASDVVPARPRWNIHGHASQANIKIGEYVSESKTTRPRWNIHGHASQSHIKIGEYTANEKSSRPRWNIHGHASQSHIKIGEMVSDAQISAPVRNPFGHGFLEQIPNVECDEVSQQVFSYGHPSDSTVQQLLYGAGEVSHPKAEDGTKLTFTPEENLKTGLLIECTSPLAASENKKETEEKYKTEVQDALSTDLVNIKLPDSNNEPSGCHRSETSQTPHAVENAIGFKGNKMEPETGLDPSVYKEEKESETHTFMKQEEGDYLESLSSRYCLEKYQDNYVLMSEPPGSHLLNCITHRPFSLPVDPCIRKATDQTAVQLSERVSLPVLMKHSITAPLIAHVRLVNKAVVDYCFVELNIEKHFSALRHFLLMEDGEFAQSVSDLLFEKLGSGQTPGELLTPLVLNSILNKALQYSLHGDSKLASNLSFALKYIPEMFQPNAPDVLNCLELRYKVDWPLNIVITESCMNKYNKIFSFLLQLKHMVWTLKDVWFHLKRTALVNGASSSVQFRQLQLFKHEMQHFVKVIQGYIANQILHVTWCEFGKELSSVGNLDEIHRIHAEYLNKAVFRGLLTEKAAPVMNVIHSIFSLILKFRNQLIMQAWTYDSEKHMAVHPNFNLMQQSYNTFKFYSQFLFKVVTNLVNRGYQPHLEDFLLRINFNNYYKDS
ncbi:gamma-tubulin complex component 6 [Protopterus annectens]|uniref:gamma-tubulin complex component 6 n=1 Tax=Protopterus annectens TaxID=7888 RepID=UPI001CFAA81E|nr:gamma-tubulin complex component 6 [Protopterus annectens]